MKEYLVLAVNGSVARFFRMKGRDIPELESGPHLVEHKTIENPEEETHGKEIFSDVKSGVNRASNETPGHAYDDHRGDHYDELERRFAQQLTKEAVEEAHKLDASEIIIAAEPKMLGYIRNFWKATNSKKPNLQEIHRDLSKFSPDRLQQYLAQQNLVPEKQQPTGRRH